MNLKTVKATQMNRPLAAEQIKRNLSGGEDMLAVKQEKVKKEDISKLELYRLIGEGYKAMQEGRASTIDEVEMRIAKRREKRG